MINKKKLYITGLVIVILSTIICCIYVRRGYFLENYLQRKIEHYNQKTENHLSIGNLSMEGISLITFNNILLTTPNDTIFDIPRTQIKINPIKFLQGYRKIQYLIIDKPRIQFSSKEDCKQIYHSFFSNTESSDSTIQNDISEKSDRYAKTYNHLLQITPQKLLVTDATIKLKKDSFNTLFYLPEIKIEDNDFFTQIMFKENTTTSTIHTSKHLYYVLEGTLGMTNHETSKLKIFSPNDEAISFPFIERKYNTTIQLDTLGIEISTEEKKEQISLSCKLNLNKLKIFHSRISSNPILFRNVQFDLNSLITTHSIEIDSSSTIIINDFPLNTYLQWSKEDTIKHVTLNLYNDQFESNKLFHSIPDGICSHLKGIETEGELSYRFHLKLDTDQIDSLEFNSSLTPHNFNILRFGNTDFREISKPFMHHAYEEGTEIEAIYLGNENPNFTTLDQISTYLKHSILYSEDGFFFSHKGFYDTALRSSLIKNIKEKRFARGGSTISMQLVKNLWLSKEKTLSRKLEEALIVWLIENKRLVSKERMFEIYLNIIEWGPRVYGVREATHFYFSKEPADLSIEEAIFMTSIIPRPKKFMWSFDQNHNLKPFLADYYRILGEKLLKHEVILAEDFEQLVPNVRLNGRALKFLKKKLPLLDKDVDEPEITNEEEYEKISEQELQDLKENQ